MYFTSLRIRTQSRDRKPATAAARRTRRIFTSFLTAITAAGVCAKAGEVTARAQTIFPNVPEFYQHQNWVNPNTVTVTPFPNWEAGGGWCWQTAVVDALYKWSVYTAPGGGKPYNTLIYPGISANATWLNTASGAIQSYADLGGTINQLLNTTNAGVLNPAGTAVGPNAAQGAAPTASLTDMSYVVDRNTGAVKVYLAGKAAPETVKQAGAAPAVGDPNSTAFQAYQGLMQDSHSTVLTIFNTAAFQNGLWWGGGTGPGNFHALAGAGYGGARQIYYADPDVVPPNAGNQNGGWVGTGITGPPPPGGYTDAQIDMYLNQAQTAVNANKYAANAAGPPIGAQYYGNMAVNNAGGITSSVATTNGLPNGNYAGTRLGGIDAVAPTDIGLVSSVRQMDGTWLDTFRLFGDVSGDISQIDIFPVVPLAKTPGFTFAKANWNPSSIFTDPYQGAWAGGGENITVGNGGMDMTNGEMQTTTMVTALEVTAFNVFEYDKTLGQWDVEAFGATGNAFRYQADAIPELSTMIPMGIELLGAGVLIGLKQRRSAPSI